MGRGNFSGLAGARGRRVLGCGLVVCVYGNGSGRGLS